MTRALGPYPAYRDSGLSWLGEVPAHWEVLPNRAIFSEVNQQKNPDEQMLSVTIAEGVIPQRELIENTSKKDVSRLDKAAYKLVQPGDIAYNKMRAWQGAIGVSRHRGIISPAYIVQRPLSSTNRYYWHYLLRTMAFSKEAERHSYGIAPDMWSLRPEDFKIIQVCVPPLPEQTAIVRFLDNVSERIDFYIDAKERLTAPLNEKKQSIIDRAVTRGLDPNAPTNRTGIAWMPAIPAHWEVQRLRSISSLFNGATPSSNIARYWNGDITWITPHDLGTNQGMCIETSSRKITHEGYESCGTSLAESGALVISTRAPIGYVSILNVPACVNQGCKLIVPNGTLIQSEYLYYIFLITHPELASLGQGSTFMELSTETLANFSVPLPPLAEQAAIVEHLKRSTDTIETTIDRTRRQIDLLREYRERLINDVVTGKLDVREARLDTAPDADALEDRANLAASDGGQHNRHPVKPT